MPEEEDVHVNEKLYYTISEVADMLHVTVSNVRYYENEFDALKVRKDSKGNRLFTQSNIETLRQIIYLTKEEGYTLEGAKKVLKQKETIQQHGRDTIKKLEDMRAQLVKLRRQLSGN